MQCPKCKSERAHRSHSRSRWEAWRREITGKRLFRCAECGWRGWAVDSGPTFSDVERAAAERALAPTPPNLSKTALAREELHHPDVDIAALDLPPATSDKKDPGAT